MINGWAFLHFPLTLQIHKTEKTLELIYLIKYVDVKAKFYVCRTCSDNRTELTNAIHNDFLMHKELEHNFYAP